MDFIVDGLASGRMVRIVSAADAPTRACLALGRGRRMQAAHDAEW